MTRSSDICSTSRDAPKKMIEAELPGATQSEHITVHNHRLAYLRYANHSVDKLLWYDPKDNLVLIAVTAHGVRARHDQLIRASGGLQVSRLVAWRVTGRLRVAIRYRAAQAIGKFGTVKRNRPTECRGTEWALQG